MMLRPAVRPARELHRRGRYARPRHPIRCFVTSSGKVTEPLKILFFGSDDFSAASLKALGELRMRKPSLVESIDVATLVPKPVGRGLKAIRDPPIVAPARSLEVPLHQLSNFDHFEMPRGVNLIIAVSFGLFIPSTLIQQCLYGGLNVHPSLLPDLYGAAPVLRAWFQKDRYYGVTLQTLDEKKFDHGKILTQTPKPGFEMQGLPLQDIQTRLAEEGALMLTQGISHGLHVTPSQDAGWKAEELRHQGKKPRHARKIKKAELEVSWGCWTAEDWARRAAFGKGVYTWVESSKRREWKRAIFHDAERLQAPVTDGEKSSIMVRSEDGSKERIVQIITDNGNVYVDCAGGEFVRVTRATMESKAETAAAQALKPYVRSPDI